MSRNEWEEGDIKLPTAEFARVRQAVADEITKNSDAIYAKAQEFWGGLTAKQKKDPTAYREAYYAFEKKNSKPVYTPYTYGRSEQVTTLPEGFDEAVRPEWNNSIARVKKTDLPYPTNKDTSFRVGWGASISFNRATSTVSWHVSENNHAVDSAHEHRVAKAFFAAIDKVKWTRGTGGYFTGNDEYTEDNREYGGGANYYTAGFGPIGAAENPGGTDEYRMADGKLVRRGDFEKVAKAADAAQRRKWAAERASAQARVQKGVSRHGGEFTNRYRIDGGPLRTSY